GRPASVQGLPAPAWLVAGLGTLALAWIAAPRTVTGDSLARAGLAAQDAAAVTAVRAPAADGRRGPHLALTLLTIGVFICGVGWGGLAQARRQDSLLGRLAPRSVTVTGSLREDPVVSAFGWHGLVDVSSVTWQGGAASLRETVW